MTELFSNIVGQDRAKRKLNFHLQNYNATGVLPHLMFTAPKDCGKTTLATAMGRLLISKEEALTERVEEKYFENHPEMKNKKWSVEPAKPKPLREINCSTIRNVRHYRFLDEARLGRPQAVTHEVEVCVKPKSSTIFFFMSGRWAAP